MKLSLADILVSLHVRKNSDLDSSNAGSESEKDSLSTTADRRNGPQIGCQQHSQYYRVVRPANSYEETSFQEKVV